MSAEEINLYRGSPRQTKYWVLRSLRAGCVPMVQGSPGIGKSAMIRGIAKELNLKLIDDRVATNGPEHYTGLPDVSGNKAIYKPFDVFPLEGDPLPLDENGKEMNGWLYFMDEFNSGLPTTLVGVYKFLLEREIAQKKVHSAVHIVAAGNRDEDRAITQQLGTALQRRLVWLEMYLDGKVQSHFDDFMKDVALPSNWSSKVIAFLNYKKQYLNNFDPEHTEKTFACPGTWEMASKFANDPDGVKPEDVALFAGAVGAAVAAEFVNFCEIYADLISLDDVLANPATAPVPADQYGNPDLQRLWATVSMLIDNTTVDNLSDIGDYVERLGLEFRILYWRSVQLRYPGLRREQAFIRAQTGLARYLYTPGA